MVLDNDGVATLKHLGISRQENIVFAAVYVHLHQINGFYPALIEHLSERLSVNGDAKPGLIYSATMLSIKRSRFRSLNPPVLAGYSIRRIHRRIAGSSCHRAVYDCNPVLQVVDSDVAFKFPRGFGKRLDRNDFRMRGLAGGVKGEHSDVRSNVQDHATGGIDRIMPADEDQPENYGIRGFLEDQSFAAAEHEVVRVGKRSQSHVIGEDGNPLSSFMNGAKNFGKAFC